MCFALYRKYNNLIIFPFFSLIKNGFKQRKQNIATYSFPTETYFHSLPTCIVFLLKRQQEKQQEWYLFRPHNLLVGVNANIHKIQNNFELQHNREEKCDVTLPW